MKLLLENWRNFLKEEVSIGSRDELVSFVTNNPKQKIFIDNPKGSGKKFGTDTYFRLPFDYGEWSNILNPADGMGWDLIVVPSADQEDKNLTPVGHLEYNEERPGSLGNDKIIVAPNGEYTPEDKGTIETFFSKLSFFNPARWYR
tara:strand:+ start:260 stop:694 length:435 start_codon:yes stop_codon:yes gene_type:complete